MGRVADGASGMSSGFCCAASAPASKNVSPRISPALIFVAIPGILYLSFLVHGASFAAHHSPRFFARRFFAAHGPSLPPFY
jgi:hypothetical protein